MNTDKDVSVKAPILNGRLDLLDVIVVATENVKTLLTVTVLIGMLTFGIVLALPRTYNSTALIALDLKDAGEAQNLITSVVMDEVADKFPNMDGLTSSGENRHESLRRRVTWRSAGGDKRSPTIYELVVNQTDPKRAQDINTALITTWLEMSKPRPIERERLIEQLKLTEVQLVDVSKIIDRYTKEATNLISPTSMQGEIATPFVRILEQRAKLTENIATLKEQLDGQTKDTILSEPSLPLKAASRAIAFSISALATVAACILTWLFLCLKEIIRRLNPDDERRQKISKISSALRFRRRLPKTIVN